MLLGLKGGSENFVHFKTNTSSYRLDGFQLNNFEWPVCNSVISCGLQRYETGVSNNYYLHSCSSQKYFRTLKKLEMLKPFTIKTMSLVQQNFTSCSESTETRHADSFCVKSVPVFSHKQGNKASNTFMKVHSPPPPPPPSLQWWEKCLVLKDQHPTERERGGGDFVQFRPYF